MTDLFIVPKGEATLVCKGTPKEIEEFFKEAIKQNPKITVAQFIKQNEPDNN